MNGILRAAAAAVILTGLAGCVVAPAGPTPGYSYGYAPGYAYAPGYYYGPPVAVGVGGCWGCGRWR
jgi:hypothetical protein